MDILTKFMVWAWDLGITIEFGDANYFGAQGHYRHMRLRLSRNDAHAEKIFVNPEEMVMWLKSGYGTSIARDLCVPEFSIK